MLQAMTGDGPTTAPRHAPAFQHLGSIGGYGAIGVPHDPEQGLANEAVSARLPRSRRMFFTQKF